MDLSEWYCRLDDVPSHEEKSFVFSTESIPLPPDKLSSRSIVAKRGGHGYGHADFAVVHIQASLETYRRLGILLLATVFHATGIELAFTHEGSEIKSLVLEKPWIMSRPSHYETRPDRFTYWPSERDRHPWTDADPEDMPRLNFAEGGGIADSSSDRGRVLLGGLLLDAGRAEAKLDEYHLEGECGFRGAGPGSAEVSLWLPGSDGWDSDLWARS